MKRAGQIGCVALFAVCCGAGVLVQHRNEQARIEVRPVELYSVVSRHFAAMRSADMAQAYRQASSTVQQRQNIFQFSDSVRPELPCVRGAARVEFGSYETKGDYARLQVFFTDAQGQVTPCVYHLVREPDGWKIDATRLKNRWPEGRMLDGMRI